MSGSHISRGAVVLALGFCIVFIHYSVRYSYGILLPEMLVTFGISKLFEAGIIYTSYFIGYTAFSFLLGLIINRADIRKVVSVFLLILGSGILLMSLSNGLIEAAISYLLAGIGCAACWVPIVVVVQRWFEKKALSVAVIDMGATIGFFLSGIIMPILVKVGGWRLGWQLFSLVSFALSPLTWLLLKSHPENSPQKKGESYKESLRHMVVLIRDLRLWMLSISYMLSGFYVMVPFTFLSKYALHEIHIPYSVAAALVSVIAVGAIPGKLVLASFSEKAGRLKAFVLSGIASIVGISGMIFASLIQNTASIIMISSAIIYGIGYGSLWPLYMAYASDIFSVERVGAVLGFLTIFFGIGCMSSPPLAGLAADLTGTLKTSFLMAGIASLLSILSLLPTGVKRKL
ncbi:MAG: MFS transporter [Candidatus Bathyarchaeia archaeon]|nr:MFS transporter [Candidatus Bathyarchaeota archaeon]